MNIKKQRCHNYVFGLLLVSFFILAGFEFETVQNEWNSAEKLINEKQYSQAEEILNSILNNLKAVNESSSEMEKMAKNIMTPQIYFGLGQIQYEQDNFENAIKCFNEITNFDIRSMWDVQAIYYSGMSEFNLKKYNEARGYFSRLVIDHKNSKEASEGQYYIGLSYELENNKGQATASFNKFLVLYPKHPWAEKVKEKKEKE